jgi:hypothetical protein
MPIWGQGCTKRVTRAVQSSVIEGCIAASHLVVEVAGHFRCVEAQEGSSRRGAPIRAHTRLHDDRSLSPCPSALAERGQPSWRLRKARVVVALPSGHIRGGTTTGAFPRAPAPRPSVNSLSGDSGRLESSWRSHPGTYDAARRPEPFPMPQRPDRV